MPGIGPSDAKIMLVQEYWGYDEERVRESIAGSAGLEFTKVLQNAGILRGECFVTALVHSRPPGNDPSEWVNFKNKTVPRAHSAMLRGKNVHPTLRSGYDSLLKEIELVKPNLIVTLGNLSLWALTGALGSLKWRGSQLYLRPDGDRPGGNPLEVELPLIKLIPVPAPSLMQYQEEARVMMAHDLRRAARHRQYPGRYDNEPDWRFLVRPTLESTMETLGQLQAMVEREPTWIECDLETRAGHIACCGLSWSLSDAISIPFMCTESDDGYWNPQAEGKIVHALYRLLTHPNCLVRGQNFLYDAQYTHRYWHFIPNVKQDTMITHHTMWLGLPKSLAFQASMYCDHFKYWKDDGKTWSKDVGEDQLWTYNCEDDVRTRESGEASLLGIQEMGLTEQHDFMQAMFWPVLQAMLRGVRVDKVEKSRLAGMLQEEIAARQDWLTRVLGHPLNINSPIQMQKLFYTDLGQKPIMSRATKTSPSHVTTNDEALETLKLREPLLAPLINKIQEMRSLGVFLSTFVLAKLDVDDRMRCSYNICGTETIRLNSSKNAFNSGGNLQNVPSGGEDDDSDLVLPNVRTLYIPDYGFEIFDTDLSKADLRIVTWESEENELKKMLGEGRDPYIETAREYYRDPSITKTRSDGSVHPKYRVFKAFAHGSHYLGTPHGLSKRIGLTVKDTERAQTWYFGKYPKIREWQKRVIKQLDEKHYVENIFGFRRYYFGRIDEATYREAIAWIAQSTVAVYINKIWLNVWNHPKSKGLIEILLQVHDSLVGQFPIHRRDEGLALLSECGRVELPYEGDPLIIPVGVKTSTKSWGDCA